MSAEFKHRIGAPGKSVGLRGRIDYPSMKNLRVSSLR